ncbi:hypothetical protein MCOR14_006043 [Pyricularia oryzae]|nr:hypothetical protein MCOR11_009999 [Pyricularia oryzae]KAI6520010.1 hypothetical protein MCOR16_008412 [Pyricularia oryzae]KAI6634818.1 hypothetical protein MCOR14_006043 [Pyricularia oryzae]KAI6636992.1 hypothetical protein MCOR08_003352 [Pyricularia oryzae]
MTMPAMALGTFAWSPEIFHSRYSFYYEGDGLLSSFRDDSLSEDAPTLWEQKLPWYRSKYRRPLAVAGCLIALLGGAVIIQAVQLSRHHAATVTGFEAGKSGRCGFTATEAMEKGCVFDYMNFSWQPAECYDPELDKEHAARMRAERPVRWWADANLTMPLPDDKEVLKMYGEVWVERRFHYKHCMYSWDSLHLSYEDGRPIPDLQTVHHSRHCAHTLDKAIKVDNGTEVLIEHAVTWFSACVWPSR